MNSIFSPRTLKIGWCGGISLGEVCALVAKVTIDMDGAILLMSGKDEARGGKGFHDVIITVEDGVT